MRSQRLYQIRERVVEALRSLKEDEKCEVYLFGSYARGDHALDSDVDVLVVSEGFEGLSRPERVSRIRRKLPEDISFEIIALTPRELEKLKDRAFYREISRYWLRI